MRGPPLALRRLRLAPADETADLLRLVFKAVALSVAAPYRAGGSVRMDLLRMGEW